MAIWTYNGMNVPTAERILRGEQDGNLSHAVETVANAVANGFEVRIASHVIGDDLDFTEKRVLEAPGIKECPFCGRRLLLHQIAYRNMYDREVRQMYYMHEEGNEKCILDQLCMPLSIGAGDARPEEGYIGEYAELWNERH